jgi:hypothetical protein
MFTTVFTTARWRTPLSTETRSDHHDVSLTRVAALLTKSNNSPHFLMKLWSLFPGSQHLTTHPCLRHITHSHSTPSPPKPAKCPLLFTTRRHHIHTCDTPRPLDPLWFDIYIVYGEEVKLWSSWLCNFLRSYVISFLFGSFGFRVGKLENSQLELRGKRLFWSNFRSCPQISLARLRKTMYTLWTHDLVAQI